MTKKQQYYYLGRINRFLREQEDVIFVFKRFRLLTGLNDINIIYIDPRRDILPTLIHECLHELYPHWPEKRVNQYEKNIFKQMSDRQIKNFLINFAFSLKK